MFGTFGRAQQQTLEAAPGGRDASVLGSVNDVGDGLVIAQYQTTRVRHMFSSYKRFDLSSLLYYMLSTSNVLISQPLIHILLY